MPTSLQLHGVSELVSVSTATVPASRARAIQAFSAGSVVTSSYSPGPVGTAGAGRRFRPGARELAPSAATPSLGAAVPSLGAAMPSLGAAVPSPGAGCGGVPQL